MNATASSTVLLAGGTGLIGRELSDWLLQDASAPRLVQVARRKPQGADKRARWLVVDFAAMPRLPKAQVAVCCLGTTIKQAGSQQAFRAVDFDAVLAFAAAAKAAGATRFGVVSALGADTRSAVFYNRVKGETEAALAAMDFASLVIARPSLLLGDRKSLGQPPRSGEQLAAWASASVGWMLPKRVRPIEAREVARGLWHALQQGAPGKRVVESDELRRLAEA